MTIFLALVLLYIWPLTINPDPERPLKWYYPLACGCFRSRRQLTQAQPHDEESNVEMPTQMNMVVPETLDSSSVNGNGIDDDLKKNPDGVSKAVLAAQ